jgi:hypothetical protein
MLGYTRTPDEALQEELSWARQTVKLKRLSHLEFSLATKLVATLEQLEKATKLLDKATDGYLTLATEKLEKAKLKNVN